MNLKHTKLTNTFVKPVHGLYIFILPAMLLLLASILLYSFSQHSIRNDRLEYIERCEALTEKNINENLYDYLANSLSRPITSLDTLSLFFETSQTDSDYFRELRIDLHNHHLIKREFQDIILYRNIDGAFVSAIRAGFNINDTYSQNSLSYADLHELLTLTRRDKPIFYLTENLRTYYIYPIYSSDSPSSTSDIGRHYAGFCAIWLDEKNFFKLDTLEPQSDGTTIIINGNDILHTNGRNLLSSTTIFEIIDQFEKSGTNFLYETLFSTDYSFYYTKSEENGLIYLYYEPIAGIAEIFFDFSSPAVNMFWFCAAIIILLTAVILFMRLKFNKAGRSNHSDKEAATQTKEFIFKNTFDLLYGNTESNSLDKILGNIINTQVPFKYTSCILIEPEPFTILKMSSEQKNDFIKNITASLDMHLDNTADTHYSIMQYPNNLITCLINSSSFMPENLAHNILEHLSTVYECHFNVFCTTPTVSLSELPRNYAFILDSCKYAHIYSYNNVFTQDTLELYEAADNMIDTGLTKKILDLINQNYFDELMQYIRNLPTVIRQRGFSYIRVKDHYRIIFNIINDYCKENQPDYQYKDMPLSNIINQFETIDECSEFLCDEITLLAEAIAAAREEAENSVSKKYIDHIIEYIDKNIETISLTSTAEHFNISVAHLSRIFKELTGTNFSDYVAEKKLQQAAKLLITDHDMSIGDIAKNLGYNTPAYFSRKFKEHFEVTPAAYRKQHLTDTQ